MILFVALILDALLGEPRWLWNRVPHPAVSMGRLIGWCDTRFNTPPRRAQGVIVMAALVILAGIAGAAIQTLAFGNALSCILAAILLAQRSLADHVHAVARALRLSLPEGRRSVAMIVGRDTGAMDTSAVARAAIESGAENLSDGVVAPAFWFLLGGLPGLLIYKITNTADSMIGYRTPRHEEFGWAAARLDDVLNWVPARLTAALIALAYLRPDAARIILRDAKLHRSPNAGWPEAAMAACLGVALSGPRAYDGQMRDFPFVNPAGRRLLDSTDIDAAVAALWRTWALMLALLAVITFAI